MLQALPFDALAAIGNALPLHDNIRFFLLLRENNVVPRFAPLLDTWLRWDEGAPAAWASP